MLVSRDDDMTGDDDILILHQNQEDVDKESWYWQAWLYSCSRFRNWERTVRMLVTLSDYSVSTLIVGKQQRTGR